MTTEATIELKNVSLRYGDQTIFSELNFTIASKKFTCLLGQSGVGKTSILQLLAGLWNIEKSDEFTGERLFEGQPFSSLPVAYMTQQDALLPWKTVRDNAVLGALLRGDPPDYSRAETLLEQVGINQAHWAKKPDQLSAGMRQRVALVRTLLEPRDIVLMDEPFSALDTVTRLYLQDLAVEYLREKTVLMITHDPLEALRMADVIYVLKGRPASVQSTLILESTKPRALTDEGLLREQARLLSSLKEAI